MIKLQHGALDHVFDLLSQSAEHPDEPELNHLIERLTEEPWHILSTHKYGKPSNTFQRAAGDLIGVLYRMSRETWNTEKAEVAFLRFLYERDAPGAEDTRGQKRRARLIRAANDQAAIKADCMRGNEKPTKNGKGIPA